MGRWRTRTASRTTTCATATCSPRAGSSCSALTTPGPLPRLVCLYAPELGTVFTGDTLFQGGPGATGRSFSSFDTIIDSIRTRLLTLPADTTVRTGHGDSTIDRRGGRRTWRSGSCGATDDAIRSSTSSATLAPWRTRRRSGSASCASTPRGTSPWPRPGMRSPVTDRGELVAYLVPADEPRLDVRAHGGGRAGPTGHGKPSGPAPAAPAPPGEPIAVARRCSEMRDEERLLIYLDTSAFLKTVLERAAVARRSRDVPGGTSDSPRFVSSTLLCRRSATQRPARRPAPPASDRISRSCACAQIEMARDRCSRPRAGCRTRCCAPSTRSTSQRRC